MVLLLLSGHQATTPYLAALLPMGEEEAALHLEPSPENLKEMVQTVPPGEAVHLTEALALRALAEQGIRQAPPQRKGVMAEMACGFLRAEIAQAVEAVEQALSALLLQAQKVEMAETAQPRLSPARL